MRSYVGVTTGVAGDGVILPKITTKLIGMDIYVSNLSAATLNVYPGIGQTINGGSANAAIVHPVSIGRHYIAESATNWRQLL
jgi:hypothetical protein